MDLNNVITLEKVNTAIILQFKYNRNRFADLFLEHMACPDNFKRINTVDTEWFDERDFRDSLFGVSNENGMSQGSICRYSFDGTKLVFGDDSTDANGKDQKNYIQQGHVYSVCRNNTDEYYFKINKINIAFWKAGIAYVCFDLELLKCLPKGAILFSDVNEFITAFDISKRREYISLQEDSNASSEPKRTKVSFREILCGTSRSKSRLAKRLGFFQMLTDAFAQKGTELSLDIDELKENYIIYLISAGLVNDIPYATDDIKSFLTPNEFSILVKNTGFSWLNKTTWDRLIIGRNKIKGFDNHYWNISNHGMICFGYKDKFLRTGGLWKNIFEKYMIIFQYCLNFKEEYSLRNKHILKESDDLYEKYSRKMFTDNEKQEHIQKLFDVYLRKMRRQIKREQLNLNEHEKIIEAASDSDDCFLPLEDDCLKDPFVFLCYCRNDYKKVYKIIDFMYKNGVNVCYDKGIHMQKGEHWTYTIDDIIKSPNCIGIIYFISEGLLQSDASIREATLARELGIPCMSISLEHKKCSDIIRNTKIIFTDFDEENNFSVREILEYINIKQIAKIAKEFSLDQEPEYVWFDRYERELPQALRDYKWIETL